MSPTTDPLLTEIADLLRRIVRPASWETSEGVQRDAGDLLERLERGVTADVRCPACREPAVATVTP